MPALKMPIGVTAVMLPELDFDEQIALCQKLGVTHYSIRPRIIAESQRGKPWGNWGNHKFDLTPERLVKEGKEIKKKLDDAGIIAFGTVPQLDTNATDDMIKLHCEGAQIVGAGRVRMGPTGYPAGPFKYFDFVTVIADKYRKAIRIAEPMGVKLVIETHCGSLAASPALALNICRHFKHTQIGTIFDIANFNIEGNYQPNLAVAVLDRYIDHCHIGGSRRSAGSYGADGFRMTPTVQAPITEADMHIPSWIKALHEAGHNVPLMVENFTENVPGAQRLTESVAALRRAIEAL